MPTVIDPGPATDAARTALRDALEELGADVSAIRQVLLTHSHPDHSALAASIAAGSGATVFAHPSALELLACDSRAEERRRQRLRRLLAAAGVPADLVQAVLASLWTPMESIPESSLKPITPRSRPNVAGHSWKVVPTPGHTPDSLAFLDPITGLLFAGDALLRNEATRHVLTGLGVDREPTGAQRLDDIVRSWRRMGQPAIETIFPGHGPEIRAPRVLIARRLAGVRQQLQLAASAVRSGSDTVWSVTEALYGPEALEPRAMLGNVGDTIALLEWLHDRGSLTRRVQSGVVRYRLPSGAAPDGPSQELPLTDSPL